MYPLECALKVTFRNITNVSDVVKHFFSNYFLNHISSENWVYCSKKYRTQWHAESQIDLIKKKHVHV